MELIEVTDRIQWDEYVTHQAWGHPLQLWGWGEVKRDSQWRPTRFALVKNGEWQAVAQVLLWPIPRTKWFVAYVPRGPVAAPDSKAALELMERIAEWAKGQQALYLRIEPAWRIEKLAWPQWRRAHHQIQMAQTFVIDLNQDEDTLRSAMGRKHRQYINKSERDGVSVVRLGVGELGGMFAIYQQTAARAGFAIHSEHYYQNLSTTLGTANYLYEARFDGRSVAFLWLAAAGSTAYELYGGVSDEGQELKANYGLKWHAIADMKAAGYTIYDFNGRVSEGVSRFKEGFGPAEVDYVGTWDRPLRPALYAAWEGLWPVLKRAGRLVRGGR